tara:strand:- start:18 stop:197 length:180 start_codon:yes stop_codon:yes gene_type:complete
MKRRDTLNSKSIGFGDTVAKVAKVVGADKVARAYTKVTGKDCGCGQRRDSLNRMFPYSK